LRGGSGSPPPFPPRLSLFLSTRTAGEMTTAPFIVASCLLRSSTASICEDFSTLPTPPTVHVIAWPGWCALLSRPARSADRVFFSLERESGLRPLSSFPLLAGKRQKFYMAFGVSTSSESFSLPEWAIASPPLLFVLFGGGGTQIFRSEEACPHLFLGVSLARPSPPSRLKFSKTELPLLRSSLGDIEDDSYLERNHFPFEIEVALPTE